MHAACVVKYSRVNCLKPEANNIQHWKTKTKSSLAKQREATNQQQQRKNNRIILARFPAKEYRISMSFRKTKPQYKHMEVVSPFL